MKDQLPTSERIESAVISGEHGRYVSRRRVLPDFNPHERVAYALWTREAKEAAIAADRQRAQQLIAQGRVRGGMVLTENGWEIPSGPLNPRIVDQATEALTPYEQAREDAIQAQVAHVAADHEHAVRGGDMWEFQRMYREWELPIRFYFEPLNA